MPKRNVIAVAVILLFTIAALTFSLIYQRNLPVSDTPSLRTAFLESNTSNPSPKVFSITQPSANETVSAKDPSNAYNAPPPLRRTPSPEESAIYFDSYGRYEGLDFFKKRVQITIDVISKQIGGQEHSINNLAMAEEFIKLGDTPTARYYLWKEAESDSEEVSDQACLVLFHFESDPRVSEKLLLRACENNAPSFLSYAIAFSNDMDSPELADYYLQRLQKISPNLAQEYLERRKNGSLHP